MLLGNLETFEGTGIILPSFSSPMLSFLTAVFATLSSVFRSRSALQLENLALRHQIGVLERVGRKRPKLMPWDRLLWVWLSRIWSCAPEKVDATSRSNFFEPIFMVQPPRTSRARIRQLAGNSWMLGRGSGLLSESGMPGPKLA